ncbi:AMP-binding protein [Kutzneria sp. NPDC052558]|uniref:AMP-binding protein n=1 Tax=Kutzneria sp. NPDC052558 TaxID=3364121 RepID=UPI0037C899EC
MSTADTPIAVHGAYAIARTDPTRVAIVSPSGRRVSFGDLVAAANQVANGLRGLGLRRGDVIASIQHNSAEHVEVVLAAFQIGLYVVPVNSHLAPSEISHIVRDSGAGVVVATDGLAGGLESADLPAARYAVGAPVPGWRPYSALRDDQPAHPPHDREAGSIMGYTSGTTGRPKGVRRPLPQLPPEVVIAQMARHYGKFGITAGRGVHLVCAPLYHAAPGNLALCSLHLGHTVVIHPRFDAVRTLEDIEWHGVTTTHLVPTHLHRLLALPDEVREQWDTSSLRVVMLAGAPCPVRDKQRAIEWLGPVVWEYLGSTEGVVCHIGPVEWLEHPGSVGKPALVKILDDQGDPTPPGEPGRIYFPAAAAPFEYHNDPAKTAAAIRSDGFATVGDIGRLDADGYLYVLDRRDDLIISGGVNIYPAEIEQHLLTHPAVADVAVIGVPDPEWGHRVLAVVRPGPAVVAGPDLAEELDAFCRAGLAALKCPRRYEFMADLPRSESGKLLRRTLRARFAGVLGRRCGTGPTEES